MFDAYVPVRRWLADLKPDVAITIYNDHGADFFFDKYPTFAVGAAQSYPIADAGFGKRPLPEVPGAWSSPGIFASRWCTTNSTSRSARR